MSRIGRRILKIPTNVTFDVSNKSRCVVVKGPLGTLEKCLSGLIEIHIQNDEITTTTSSLKKKSRQMWGTTNALLKTYIDGVVTGFKKTLILQGLGFKSQLKGQKLHLNLGFSHEVIVDIPTDIQVKIVRKNTIDFFGIDKEKVGLICSQIRKLCPTEPYKGKGVRYHDEIVKRKVGKTSATKK